MLPGRLASLRRLPAATLLLSVVAALMPACSPPPNDYAAYENLPSEGWKYGDTITFTPTHPDTLCPGRIIVGMRHSNSYPFTSLWVEVTYTDENPAAPAGKPAGHSVGSLPSATIKDTLEIHLTDKYGSWTGRGIGASFQHADTLPATILHRSGTPVKIRHIMRDDTLGAIQQLGIIFLPQ